MAHGTPEDFGLGSVGTREFAGPLEATELLSNVTPGTSFEFEAESATARLPAASATREATADVATVPT